MRRTSFIAVAAVMSVGAVVASSAAGAATKTTKKASKTTKRSPTTKSGATVAPPPTTATTAAPTTRAATAPPTTARGGKPVDLNGVLRIGTQLTVAAGYEVDPAKGTGTNLSYDAIAYLNMGMPLMSRDGVIEPYLAESYSIVNPRTVVLKLRPGLTFQDGKPYDAQTLRDAYLDRRDRGLTAYNVGLMRQIDNITVESPTQLTFRLSAPVAGSIVNQLATAFGAVASPGTNTNLPAGAGPYKTVEYRDRQFLKLERWDGFFRAKDFLLKGVEYTNIVDPAAKQAALRSGQVDLISNGPGDIDALINTGPFAKVVTNNEGSYQFSLCSTSPPLFDTKLRRAIMLAIDKNQINQVVLGGNAVPMEGFMPPSSKFAVKGLLKPEGDQEAARALLREIRWDGSKVVNIGVFNIPTHLRIAEVVQGQLDKVGIKVQILPIPAVASNVINDRSGGGVILAQVNAGIGKATVTFVDKSTAWNSCDFSDPALTIQIQRLTDGDASEAEQIQVWTALQKRVIDDALAIPLLTQPCVYAYNKDKIQGLQPGTIGLTCATTPAMFLEGVSAIAK